jgi:hypothetical protein
MMMVHGHPTVIDWLQKAHASSDYCNPVLDIPAPDGNALNMARSWEGGDSGIDDPWADMDEKAKVDVTIHPENT